MPKLEMIDVTDVNNPLVSCSEGNLPAKMVRKEAHWFNTENEIVLQLRYFFAWDHESKCEIRRDLHIMLKKGLAIAGKQAKF